MKRENRKMSRNAAADFDALNKLNQALFKIDSGAVGVGGSAAASVLSAGAVHAGTKRKAEEAVAESSASAPAQLTMLDYSKYVWLRYFDPTSLKYYYFNAATNTTQWDMPTKQASPSAGRSEELANKDPVAPVENATVGDDNNSSTSQAQGSETETTVSAEQDAAKTDDNDNDNDNESLKESASIDTGPSSSEIDPIVYDGNSGQLLSDPSNVVAKFSGPSYPMAPQTQQNVTDFSNYSVRASFNSTNGRFAAADGTYWDKVGLPNDREGRQLSRFMDLSGLQQNREHSKVTKVRSPFTTPLKLDLNSSYCKLPCRLLFTRLQQNGKHTIRIRR
jgi:hypothetical protein